MARQKSPYRRPHRKIKSAEKNHGTDSILSMLVKNGEKQQAPAAPVKREVPKPPYDVLDKVGMAEWKRVCEVMIENGTLTDLDLTTLMLHCVACSDFVKACNELKKAKAAPVQQGKKNGGLFRNPWYDIQKKAAQEMNTYSVILGFSQRDRKNKGSQPDTPANEFDRI